ncbi:MAG: hypothetical protein R3E39_23215 [Anaerolineae bacterium]
MYTFKWLSPQLLLITWLRTPTTKGASEFVNDFKQLLENTTEPFFIITDLRKGRIIDVRILEQLGKLSQHPHWAGSTAFSQNPVSSIFADAFTHSHFVETANNMTFDRPEDAIAFLEKISPKLTDGIDWDSVLAIEHHS